MVASVQIALSRKTSASSAYVLNDLLARARLKIWCLQYYLDAAMRLRETGFSLLAYNSTTPKFTNSSQQQS